MKIQETTRKVASGYVALVVLPLLAVAVAGFNATAPEVLTRVALWRAVGQSLVIALSAGGLALGLGGAILVSSRILRQRLGRAGAAGRLELSASLILVVPPFVLATGLFVLLRPVADVFALGMPLVVGYTIWMYWAFKGKVDVSHEGAHY